MALSYCANSMHKIQLYESKCWIFHQFPFISDFIAFLHLHKIDICSCITSNWVFFLLFLNEIFIWIFWSHFILRWASTRSWAYGAKTYKNIHDNYKRYQINIQSILFGRQIVFNGHKSHRTGKSDVFYHSIVAQMMIWNFSSKYPNRFFFSLPILESYVLLFNHIVLYMVHIFASLILFFCYIIFFSENIIWAVAKTSDISYHHITLEVLLLK